MERRLAAILAADVVGFSRLVQVDEAATLGRLKDIWGEIVKTNFTARRDHIFKIMGDGGLPPYLDAMHQAGIPE